MRWIFTMTFAIILALILSSLTIGYSFQAGNNSAKSTYITGNKTPSHQSVYVVTRVPYSLKHEASLQPSARQIGQTMQSNIIGLANSANITPDQTKTVPSEQLSGKERSITSQSGGKYVNLTNNMTSLNLFKTWVEERKERRGELIKKLNEKAPRGAEQVPAQVRLPSNAPEIIGDANSITKINLALDLLRSKAPKQFEIVCKYIRVIQVVDEGSGMYAWEKPPRFAIGKKSVNPYGVGSKIRSIILASTILHDAVHSKLYNDYLSEHPGSSVPEIVYSGRDAERLCLAQQYDAAKMMGGNEWVLNYIRNSINNRYYEIPVKKRDW